MTASSVQVEEARFARGRFIWSVGGDWGTRVGTASSEPEAWERARRVQTEVDLRQEALRCARGGS